MNINGKIFGVYSLNMGKYGGKFKPLHYFVTSSFGYIEYKTLILHGIVNKYMKILF